MLADVTTTMLQNVYNFLFVLIIGSFYRLKEPILKSLWGSRKGFSILTSLNLNGFGWNVEYKCGTTVRTRTKCGKSPEAFYQTPPKRVCFCHQYNAAFRTLILHWFRPCLKQQTWICVPWEISESLRRAYASPQKLPPEAVFWVGCLLPGYSSNGTLACRATGIISWASRHHKDVPFIRDFWRGMYGFALRPPK